MAKKKQDDSTQASPDSADDIATALIHGLNKEFGHRVAYNLNTDSSPTHVKRWIPTGSVQLDYIISNRRGGGCPEGRIIEISGPPSSGKSHIAFAMARNVQKMGGIVVYIDSENAVPLEKLAQMGIDVSKRFLYCDTHCTEEVFKIAEAAVLKAASARTQVPILIVWDSVAATSPKAELEGEYDDQQMGLQARTIAKALRKITGVIASHNVTFLCLNQIKSKVGVVFGSPEFTPGGAAIPFHASVRVKLSTGKPIKIGEAVVGIEVTATIIKNKVSRPYRKAEFSILFGHGIVETEQLFSTLLDAMDAGPVVTSSGVSYIYDQPKGGSWRTLIALRGDEPLYEKRFQKSDLPDLMQDPEFAGHVADFVEKLYVVPETLRVGDISDEDAADSVGADAVASAE